VIARMASGLFVLALATSCKDKPEPAPRPAARAGSAVGSGSTSAPPVVSVDAASVAPPIDAADLPTVTPAERAMVTKWFARLNGTGVLVIKGVDVEPFRQTHLGQRVDAGTTIAYAMVPKEGKRTFVVTQLAISAGKRSDTRVYMTFDDKDALVGISY
jgi:hypothetical protein